LIPNYGYTLSFVRIISFYYFFYATLGLISVHPRQWMGTMSCFQLRNENFFARSRKTKCCAETHPKGTYYAAYLAYVAQATHKPHWSLTQRLRKKAIYVWKLIISVKRYLWLN